ncbi:YceD family protein [Echinimonas agarilytica]|uniref:Large ribosomal RNA subunit accumulation protein YceD n=1 Tax=Echinimonas agarilytica TaxID=1215918 RepID=A0AA41W748_9GAMM|nr:YceD family protein [Echinimonas agarilytica]MCM2679851.1 YceD family protein [Echinimonas agarilytica]
MQKVNIPVHLDPGRSATKQQCFDGVIPQRVLQRLSDVSVEDGGVDVAIACDRDEQHLATLTVTINTQLKLECQRCNEPFLHDIGINVIYSPVKDDAAAEQLPAEYEAVILPEADNLNLHQLIEDEILLAVPYVPMHLPSECKQESHTSWGKTDDAQEDKPNPFAVLNKLKSSEE